MKLVILLLSLSHHQKQLAPTFPTDLDVIQWRLEYTEQYGKPCYTGYQLSRACAARQDLL